MQRSSLYLLIPGSIQVVSGGSESFQRAGLHAKLALLRASRFLLSYF